MEKKNPMQPGVAGALVAVRGIMGIGQVSRGTVYTLMKDPTFPPKRLLGPRIVRYRIDEVVEYFKRRADSLASRPAPSAAQCNTPEAHAKRAATKAGKRAAKLLEKTPAELKSKARTSKVRPPTSHPIAPTGAVAEAMDRVSRNPSLNEAGQ